MLLVQEVYLKLSTAHWRSGLKASGQGMLDSFIYNDLYFCMGKQLFKWKHSEHQKRENTFSMWRFLKAASLFVFFSENSAWICCALFYSCLVSLHNKLIRIKPFIFSVLIRHMQYSQLTLTGWIPGHILHYDTILWTLRLINELYFSLKGNPSRWSSSLLHADSPLPSPSRHRQGCVWYMADIR